MKRKLITTMLLMVTLGIYGCTQFNALSESSNGTSESKYYSKYERYYNIGTDYGLEMYAWKDNNNWFGGLIHGTERLKTVDEIKEFQELNCPINILKEIFNTYDEYVRYNFCFLIIVSIPPKEEELTHSLDNISKQYDDYLYLWDYFGMRHVLD